MVLSIAGVIHTDFEKGFICAEVMTFEDLKELGDEEAVKKAGKLRQQGKKYVVQDADVIFFKVSADPLNRTPRYLVSRSVFRMVCEVQ